MYIGNSGDLKAYQSFMAGFQSAISTLGLEYPVRSRFDEVFRSRGWKSSWIDIHDMREKGLNDEQIIRELMSLEILIWKSEREKLDL